MSVQNQEPAGPLRGVRLGVDVGLVRVGLAASDPDGIMASPLKTLKRDPKRNSDIKVICKKVAETGALWVFVGLPRSLSGGETASTQMARDFAQILANHLAQETLLARVSLVDERLTTVSAHKTLHDAGIDSRDHRKVVDQVAAVNILEQALAMQKTQGVNVGIGVPARLSESNDDLGGSPA